MTPDEANLPITSEEALIVMKTTRMVMDICVRCTKPLYGKPTYVGVHGIVGAQLGEGRSMRICPLCAIDYLRWVMVPLNVQFDEDDLGKIEQIREKGRQ